MREDTALMLIRERIATVNEKKKSKKTILVNLVGGPCSGKSKTAMLITALLKQKGIRAEYVSEVAKEYVYKHDNNVLNGSMRNQTKLLLDQSKRIDIPYFSGMVDVVITDSPLLINCIYNKDVTNEYFKSVYALNNCYNNTYYFMKRTKDFDSNGRKQKSLNECIKIDKKIKKLLDDFCIKYEVCSDSNLEKIVEQLANKVTRKSKKQKH